MILFQVIDELKLYANMTQDCKCFWGLHKYEILKEVNVFDYDLTNTEETDTGELKTPVSVGINIISRCSNCGKTHTNFVATDINRINQRT